MQRNSRSFSGTDSPDQTDLPTLRVKPEIQVLGVDDAPFLFEDSHAALVGCVFRGGEHLDGVLASRIEKDGLDATDSIAGMLSSSSHSSRVRVILLDGITFGGFNVVDIRKLSSLTSLPVLVVLRRHPDLPAFYSALSSLPFAERTTAAAENAGDIKRFNAIYFQHYAISERSARDVLQVSTTHSNIPEPLRIAHMIARAFGSLK